jgi:CPA2 family monovalent cation:H+ antiporter-2
MLLFIVGTEFPIAKLRAIGKKTLVIALSEAFGTFVIGYIVGQQMGLALFDSLFLALSISVTSTVIVMRVLEELGMLREEASYLLLGVAVIEDIIIISMLAVLQSVAATGHLSIAEIAISIGMVVGFIASALFVGSKTIPKVVDRVSRTNQYDLLLITVLGGAFGLSYIANLIGISVATGAFFAGVLVAESKAQGLCQDSNNSVKRHVCSYFLRFCRRANGYQVTPIIHNPCPHPHCNVFWSKVWNSISFSTDSRR